MRQRCVGVENQYFQNGDSSLSSRALLTGFGLLVGFMPLRRTGKPQVMD